MTDPTRIDWPARQARALIPFEVVNGRPVNPCERTGRRGQGGLRHWGAQVCADTVMPADCEGGRWLLMIERADGHGWALPGGKVDEGEDPATTAVRELEEETGLVQSAAYWRTLPARYVPDPRATDEAWMVTVPSATYLGTLPALPAVKGADDAARAAWVRADSHAALVVYLCETYGGRVFPAHEELLHDLLG